MNNPKFKGLCVGDPVFVVAQHRGPKSIAGNVNVVKMGRKFGYIMGYYDPVPFNLQTGESHHSAWNSRANGFGFDVYNSEAEYLEHKAQVEQSERLTKRLRDFRAVKASHNAVMSMHAILDAEEANQQETT